MWCAKYSTGLQKCCPSVNSDALGSLLSGLGPSMLYLLRHLSSRIVPCPHLLPARGTKLVVCHQPALALIFSRSPDTLAPLHYMPSLTLCCPISMHLLAFYHVPRM